jgi:hypothetical protein
MNFIDDGLSKPVGINEYIGRRPIAAFGNSDDLEMLQLARAVIAPSKTGVNRDCGAKPS